MSTASTRASLKASELNNAWVADVGGTSIRIAVVSPSGDILAELTYPTSEFSEPTLAWAMMMDSWQSLDPGRTPAGIAISLPARVKNSGVIDYIPNIPTWTGSNPVSTFASATGTPAHALFDIHAALRGERWKGEDVPPTFYFFAIGTGIGGAFQVDGHLACGAHNIAGMPAIPLPGFTQENGWVETVASGPAVALACGAQSGQEALARALSGDNDSLKAFEKAALALQKIISIVTVVVDASEVRVGGGFGIAAFDLLFPHRHLTDEYRTYPPVHNDVIIRPASTGSQAQVLGLAATVFGK